MFFLEGEVKSAQSMSVQFSSFVTKFILKAKLSKKENWVYEHYNLFERF
jgi:hypothetical protein